MSKKNKTVKNKKEKTMLIAIAAVFLVMGYAVFAQPLAYNMAIRAFEKITEIIVGDKDSDDNKDSNDNNEDDKNKDNNNKNKKPSNINKVTNKDPDSINVSTSTSEKWNISFTKAIKMEVHGNAREKSPVTFDALSASFDVSLTAPGDKISYEFTISNKGIIDAKLDDITLILSDLEDNVVDYQISGIDVGDKLKAGESTTMIVTISYKETADEKVTFYRDSAQIIINYVQD